MKDKFYLARCSLVLVFTGIVFAGAGIESDVVVIGAGSSGIGAAVQAAKMGAKIVLVSESSHIGGQILVVPTMDIGPFWRAYPNGLFGEFVKQGIAHYSAMGKSVATDYFWDIGWAFEPHVVENVLRKMLIAQPNITLLERAQVIEAQVSNGRLKALRLADGRLLIAPVFIDATEYGDVIRLSGAEALIGNGTDKKPGTCIQDITWPVFIRKYEPGQMPEFLKCKNPPKQYEQYREEFRHVIAPNGSGTGGYPANFNKFKSYRGMPDSFRGGSYTALQPSDITNTGANWANDYPSYAFALNHFRNIKLSVDYLLDLKKRGKMNCEAKLKTWCFVCYVQDKFGLNEPDWALSTYEYFGPGDSSCEGIPTDVEGFFPPFPYVRESVRINAMHILTLGEIWRRQDPNDGQWRGQPQIHGIGISDYHVDLHNCSSDVDMEPRFGGTPNDLNGPVGPFQIPLESLIPKLGGLIAAEKNIGASRLALGAVRLQPATMAIGQAAGALAVLAVRSNIQPRAVRPWLVQKALAENGSAVSQHAFRDVDFSRDPSLWQAVQLATVRGFLQNYFPEFGAEKIFTRREAAMILAKLFDLPLSKPQQRFRDVSSVDEGAAEIEAVSIRGLMSTCSYDDSERFCPDEAITRRQLAVSLAKGLNLVPVNKAMFNDVNLSEVAGPLISAAAQAKIMGSCGASNFCPNKAVSRGDMAKACAGALNTFAW